MCGAHGAGTRDLDPNTHTGLRCIPVLIRAGNKAVLLKEEGRGGKNRQRKRGREEEDGNGDKGGERGDFKF